MIAVVLRKIAFLSRWLSPALLVPALGGVAVGVVIQVALLLIGPSVSVLARSLSGEVAQRFVVMIDLLAVPVGLGCGLYLYSIVPRYVRTYRAMPGLITDTDHIIVALLFISLTVWITDKLFNLPGVITSWQLIDDVLLAAILISSVAVGIGAAFVALRHSSATRPSRSTDVIDIRSYFSDDAIAAEGDVDLLDRGEFLSALASLLRDQKVIGSSAVIAINGEYGTGKTSVLRLLDRRLQESPDQFLTVWFDPWHFGSPPALLRGFFDSIRASVDKRFLIPDLGRAFEQYLTALSPTLGRLGLSLDPFRPPEVEFVRSKIGRLANQLQPRLVVVIDDMDRLERDELLMVLKLVKLSAMFPNVTYVLAMDRSRVEEMIGAEGSEFLGKFIDVDVELPSIDLATIHRFLVEGIKQIANRWTDRHISGLDIVDAVVRQQLRRAIPTIREAKRTLNTLAVALSQVPGEVNLADMLLLEVIRRRSLEAWTFVAEHPEVFLSDSDSLPDRLPDAESARARNESFQLFMGHVPADQRGVIQTLIETVFPIVKIIGSFGDTQILNDARQQRARVSHYFPRYFMYRLRPNSIRDQDIRTLVRQVNERPFDRYGEIRDLFSEAIGRWKENRFEAFDRLVVISKEFSLTHHYGVVRAI